MHGKNRGFPIKNVGNDSGAIEYVGHDRRGIEHVGHDRRGLIMVAVLLHRFARSLLMTIPPPSRLSVPQ